MSKKSAELKELELREQRANAGKAEVELKRELIYLSSAKRERKQKLSDPERYGVFKFNAEVSAVNCEIFSDKVERWARLNPGKPITIVITTPGGNVLHGFGLYDTIRALAVRGHHITTVVRGYAASFGAVLLQAGDVRIVGPESRVMLHEVSAGAYGKLHEIKDQTDFIKELNTRIFEVLAERANVDGQDGRSLYKWAKAKDRWLNAEACLAMGFADEVG